MNLRNLFNRWKLTTVKLNAKFLEAEFEFRNADKFAAWDLYIELLTRVATQRLLPQDGDEATALTSIYSLFNTTREILKEHGPESIKFAQIAIPVLNQIIRPFTAKWHKMKLEGGFEDPITCKEFRNELETLQTKLHNYTQLLSEVAGVEDLTSLEA